MFHPFSQAADDAPEATAMLLIDLLLPRPRGVWTSKRALTLPGSRADFPFQPLPRPWGNCPQFGVDLSGVSSPPCAAQGSRQRGPPIEDGYASA